MSPHSGGRNPDAPLALDDPQRSLRWQVWRVVFTFGLRAMLNDEFDREREPEARLEELARNFAVNKAAREA